MITSQLASERHPISHSFRTILNLLVALSLAVTGLGVTPLTHPVSAASWTVTSTADSGPGSLRQAVLDAASGDTITFSLTTPATITLTSEISIAKDLTITGPGTAALTISGGNTTRIFKVTAGTVRLNQMTIANGYIKGSDGSVATGGTVSALGGAILIAANTGVVAMSVNFQNNKVVGGNGGPSSVSSPLYGGGGGGVGGNEGLEGGYGGGGGGGNSSVGGGNGGFGGGGGGGGSYTVGGSGSNGGGNGGYIKGGAVGYGGGGGGAALGGAIYIQAGGALALKDSTLSSNSVQGGNGGSSQTDMFGGGGGGGGAGLGSAVFSAGSLCIISGVTFSSNTASGGAKGNGAPFAFSSYTLYEASAGSGIDTTPGYYEYSATSDSSCAIIYYKPSDLAFSPASIQENLPVGTTAGSFSTTDSDTGDTFTYSLVAGTGSTDNASFSISGSNLLTAVILDYEAKSTYSIRVRTTDSHNLYREETFTISITNVNDAPTGVTLSANTFAENISVGTGIGTLTAVDQESASSYYIYALVNPGGSCSGTDNASFSITGNQLKSATTFDHETKSSFTICVRVTDDGSPVKSFDQQLTLSTTNVDEQPTGVGLSNSSINENVSLGTVVGVLSTTDPDVTDTFTYTLVSDIPGCTGTDNAAFAISGSNLVTKAALNHEVKKTYAICVKSTDSGSLTASQSFTISVTDVNDTPTNVSLSNALVQENAAAGTAVGSLTTTDEDLSQTHAYQLASAVAGCDGTDNADFTIEGSTLKTNAVFDYETQNSYSVCVRTTDSGSPALDFARSFTIEIGDANEVPSNISLSNSSIAENSAINTSIGDISSFDPDSGQSTTYTLVTTAGCTSADRAAFSISGTSLRTAANLDHETQSSYTICVQATDNGVPVLSSVQQFPITITDVNETPTLIGLSNDKFDENLSSGVTIGAFSTSDPDASQSFTYSLDSSAPGCDGTDNASFSISGANLISGVAANYEAQNSYKICVRSTDNGSPTLSLAQSFAIQVNDVNETPTDLHLSNASLDEHLPIDSLVGNLTTTDPDLGQSDTYSLMSGVSGCPSTDNASFAVDGATLRTAADLDFEIQSSYSVCLRTTDSGSPALSFTTAFTITVTDVNESPTDLSLSNNVVTENQPTGTLIGSLSSTDSDSGQTFTYALTSSGSACPGTDNAFFTVSGDSLFSAASFDFETKNAYEICLSSTDSGSPARRRLEAFTIQVTDLNETPTAIHLSVTSLAETTPPDSTVGTLTTSDPDLGQSFSYALVSDVAGCDGTDNPSFSISGGQLKTVSALDFETQSRYSICLRTTDDGSPSLDYAQAFTLDVTDINESPYLNQALADQTTNAGALFQLTVPSSTFVDPDGDVLTYAASLASGDPLPAWLSFNPATRAFSGTPIQAQTLSILVTVTDSSLETASDTFSVEVVKVVTNNNPVVFQPIPNASAAAGKAFSFTFAADTFVDRDLDTLVYQAVLSNDTPLPAWLTFAPSTRTFSGTPAASDAGALTVKVYAFDGKGGQTFTTFSLGVDKNVAPAINNPIPDQSAARGDPWIFQFSANTFIDPENDPLTYTARLSDGSALPIWLFFTPSTRTFSGTPPASDDSISAYLIRVTASDGNPGNEVSATFRFSLWSFNDESNVLPLGSQVVIAAVPDSGPDTPPTGVEPLNQAIDFQILYDSEPITELEDQGIQVCFEIGPEESDLVNGDLSRLVIGTSHNGGAWQLLETTIESDPLRICAYSNQFSLFDVFLKQVSEDIDDVTELPATGFAPNQVTLLPEQPADLAYLDLGDVWLEIPSLNLKTSIVGVPLTEGNWDVSWLWNNVGWLNGSAFPGLDGNSILTGHVVNSSGLAGPFAHLVNLAWGDRIIVHVSGDRYVFEVRTVKPNVDVEDVSALDHASQPTLTIITCRIYDAKLRTYLYRTIVTAVLVKIESE